MSDKKTIFGMTEMPTEEVHKWRIVDKPGKFMMVEKNKLFVDHVYQRENINEKRILKIAAEWSWTAFGALIVAVRPDGTYWVVDGQHRKLAADKRTSITKLPCLLFETEKVKEEAEGFLAANTLRGPVSSYDRYRCKLACNDIPAMAVQQMIEGVGYRVSRSGNEKNTVTCIALLTRSYELDPRIAKNVWDLAIRICAGEHLIEDLYAALFHVERKLAKSGLTVCDRINADKLVSIGQGDILKKIRDLKIVMDKGGPAVSAQAIILLLNKGRKANRLPNYSTSMPNVD